MKTLFSLNIKIALFADKSFTDKSFTWYYQKISRFLFNTKIHSIYINNVPLRCS